MHGRLAMVVLVAVLAACAGTDDPANDPSKPAGTSTAELMTQEATEAAAVGLPRPPDDTFSRTIVGEDGGPPPVELAFAGVLEAVDDGGPVPWMTFTVHHWFTEDLGTTIGLWAPDFDAAAGQEWLVAATPYELVDRPGGDVLAEHSTAWDHDAFAAWEQEWDGSVPPGRDTAEASADPAVLADLAEARERWEANEPPAWTATIRWSEGEGVYGTCGDGPVRVVVEQGRVTQAVDLEAGCDIIDPPTVAALFDRMEQVAGAFQGPPAYDDDLGYPASVSARDRSVQFEARIDEFVAEVRPLASGGPGEALADARDRWTAAGIDDYTMAVEPECFCAFRGVVDVEVVDGQVHSVAPREPEVTAESYDGLDLTVEGIFAEIAASIETGRAEVTYDDDLGHPTWAALDPQPNAIDDERTWTVLSLQPSGD